MIDTVIFIDGLTEDGEEDVVYHLTTLHKKLTVCGIDLRKQADRVLSSSYAPDTFMDGELEAKLEKDEHWHVCEECVTLARGGRLVDREVMYD